MSKGTQCIEWHHLLHVGGTPTCVLSAAQAKKVYVISQTVYLLMIKSTTSLTAAVDGGTAVAAHVRRARGRDVRGAGLDEYDGLARPSAAEGRGRAHYIPDTCVLFVCRNSYGCNSQHEPPAPRGPRT